MTDPNRADLELHVAYRFAATNEPRVGQVPGPLNEDGSWKWVDPPRRRFGCAWLPLLLLALAVGG